MARGHYDKWKLKEILTDAQMEFAKRYGEKDGTAGIDSQLHNGTVENSGRDAGVDHAGAMSAVHAGLRREESVPEV